MSDSIKYSTLEHSRRDGEIRAFIVNADRLAEGDYVAAWHPFPCTAGEMAATLKEIGIDGERYADFTIEDYSAKVPGLAMHLPANADLNELNCLAVKLEGMNMGQRETFAAAVDARLHTDNLRSLLNLTENLESYTLNPAALNEQSLGLIEFEAERDLANAALGALEASTFADADAVLRYIEVLEPHFNAEHYGKALHLAGNGLFTENGYLEKSGIPFEISYLGNEHIPVENRVYEYIRKPPLLHPERVEYVVAPPAHQPVKVADMDLSALVFKMHALSGDHLADVGYNLQKLAEPGGQHFLLLDDGLCMSVNDLKVLYSDQSTREDLGIPGNGDGVRAYLLDVSRHDGARVFGTLAEMDFGALCQSIEKNSIIHSCVTAQTKSGDELLTSREEWNALPLTERLRFQSWVTYPSPDDAAKLAGHLRDMFARQYAIAQSISPEAFLEGQNRAYMARAGNPQPSMVRIPQQAARQMIKAGDANVYRLLPGNTDRLDISEIQHNNLDYSNCREFAVRYEEWKGLEKWAAHETADCISQIEQARQAAAPKRSRGTEL